MVVQVRGQLAGQPHLRIGLVGVGHGQPEPRRDLGQPGLPRPGIGRGEPEDAVAVVVVVAPRVFHCQLRLADPAQAAQPDRPVLPAVQQRVDPRQVVLPAHEVVAAREGDLEQVRLGAGSFLNHDGLLLDIGPARADMHCPRAVADGGCAVGGVYGVDLSAFGCRA